MTSIDQDSLSPLQARLLAPPASASLLDLALGWRETVVAVRCPAPAGIAFRPEDVWRLPGALRGALGRQLAQSASAEAKSGRPCPWDPPCALDVLFRTQGQAAGGLEIPKPFVLTVDLPDRRTALVNLALFGLAGDWAAAAAAALVRALGEGVYLHGAERVTLAAAEVNIHERLGLDLTEAAFTAGLDFITPVSLRSQNDLQLSAPQLLASLANRVSGLARWQGVALAEDFRALKATAGALQWAGEDLRRVAWERRSSRQPGRLIRMEGWLGRLLLRGALLELSPLLELGQRCLAGGRTVFGQGRYRLTWWN